MITIDYTLPPLQLPLLLIRFHLRCTLTSPTLLPPRQLELTTATTIKIVSPVLSTTRPLPTTRVMLASRPQFTSFQSSSLLHYKIRSTDLLHHLNPSHRVLQLQLEARGMIENENDGEELIAVQEERALTPLTKMEDQSQRATKRCLSLHSVLIL